MNVEFKEIKSYEGIKLASKFVDGFTGGVHVVSKDDKIVGLHYEEQYADDQYTQLVDELKENENMTIFNSIADGDYFTHDGLLQIKISEDCFIQLDGGYLQTALYIADNPDYRIETFSSDKQETLKSMINNIK